MRTQWNDAEDEAMDYLPHVDQIIYLRGIRRRMDYQTGIAGMTAAISYDWLSQLAEVHPERGSKAKAPQRLNKESLRAVFARLERAGLIERVRDHGARGLVFRCPLADWDASVSGRNNPRTTPEQPVTTNPETFSHGAACAGMNNPRTTPGTCSMNNPIPESGIREESGAKAPPCRADEKPSRFGEFWDAWPAGQRKRDRHKAEQAWKRLRLDAMADMIVADVKTRAVADQQWLRGYTPMPTTYLNGRRWEDEMGAPPVVAVPSRASLHDRNRSALDAWLNSEPSGIETATVIEGDFRRDAK